MDIYKINTADELIRGNSYVGRGIVVGKTPNGEKAASAYFIMGRSANSRNRVFTKKDEAVFTEPFDASKVEDPSLIIYAAIRAYENKLIVTNGDQTDTIWEGLKMGRSFTDSLAGTGIRNSRIRVYRMRELYYSLPVLIWGWRFSMRR